MKEVFITFYKYSDFNKDFLNAFDTTHKLLIEPSFVQSDEKEFKEYYTFNTSDINKYLKQRFNDNLVYLFLYNLMESKRNKIVLSKNLCDALGIDIDTSQLCERIMRFCNSSTDDKLVFARYVLEELLNHSSFHFDKTSQLNLFFLLLLVVTDFQKNISINELISNNSFTTIKSDFDHTIDISYSNKTKEASNYNDGDLPNGSYHGGNDYGYEMSGNTPSWLNQIDVNESERRGLNFFDSENFDELIKKTALREHTFSQDVLEYCYRQGIINGGIFESEIGVSRNIFKNLKNDNTYVPNKRIALSLCVGLRLTQYETEDLLSKAGISLSNKLPFDSIIINEVFNKNNYDIDNINELLYKEGFKHGLGTEHKN